MRTFAVLSLLVATSAIAKELYFSEIVKRPEFKKNWDKIIAGHKFRTYDKWITRHDGVRGPVEYIKISGAKYIKDWGCEPHDCTDNSIVILANTETNDIWMVHRVIFFPDKKISFDFFGNPDRNMKENLVKYLVKP